ncbi:MAG: restriction endonuclease subunit S [Thalassospira sp.]|uniref:restriction endonuclease subunit S n=1 Tax=Thalassospira sp. TaxID=1912094 RepID=UPI0032EAAE9F
MAEIATSTLDEVCELIVDCPHFTPEWTERGYIVIRNQNIRDGRLDLSSKSFTNKVDFERRTKRAKPQAGDIIFTREAPMGEVCLIPNGLECCVGQRQVLLRPGKNIDQKYLFYALQSPFVRHQIFWNEGTGSTVSNVRIPVLKALKIPRGHQNEEQIGSILSVLDNKIDLNRRMNETLEAMARALFKDWFVDFGPTKAKMAGRPPYLAPEIWSLFPDRLDDDGKPKGWKAFQLNQIAEHHKCTLKPSAVPDELFEHFSLPAFDKTQSPALDYGSTIKSNKTIVPPEAVLLSKLNPEIPRVWLTEGTDTNRQIASTEFLAFTAKEDFGRGLLFSLFLDRRFREILLSMVTGTSKSHQRISPPSLMRREVIVGDEEMFSQFQTVVEPMLKRICSNRAETRTVAQTRDFLLPKLMSGEIGVADAEQSAQEAR